MEKLTIKSWALDDRPREKLLGKWKTTLSDAELIAILIGSGNREETAVALSKRILNLLRVISITLQNYRLKNYQVLKE